MGLGARMDLLCAFGAARARNVRVSAESTRIPRIPDQTVARSHGYASRAFAQLSCVSDTAVIIGNRSRSRAHDNQITLLHFRGFHDQDEQLQALSTNLERTDLSGDCVARVPKHQHPGTIVDFEHALSLSLHCPIQVHISYLPAELESIGPPIRSL